MISKELLSAVLGLHCGIKSIKNSEVIYWFDCIGEIREHSINIYELAHKCKEWAYTNKYRLSSSQHRLNTKQEYYINNQIASYFCSVYYITNDDSDIQIDANTEPEAIFKACQWILDKDSK